MSDQDILRAVYQPYLDELELERQHLELQMDDAHSNLAYAQQEYDDVYGEYHLVVGKIAAILELAAKDGIELEA